MSKILSILGLLLMFVGLATSQSVCIDAGHGGSDPGAVGWGLEEEDINLDVANRLCTLLKGAGWKVYMTRSSDSDVSLSGRTSYANSVGASRFISIHCNAFNQSAHGTETYCYSEGSSTSFGMRDRVNPQVVNALNTYNRGCKTASYYVLKYTNMPAILCELAFIDNQQDAAKLGDSYYRQKAAEGIKTGFLAGRSEEESLASSEGYIAPSFSPDGSRMLVSKPGHNGLYVVSMNGGSVKSVASVKAYGARWISNNEIAYKSSDREGKSVVTVEGESISSESDREEISVVSIDGEIWVEMSGEKRQLTNGGDIYFNPVLSQNKSMVCYEGLSSGLHVSDIKGEFHVALGAGNNPSWTPDNKSVVFDLALDNGHVLTESDIWVASIEQPKERFNMTKNGKMVAQRPSVSPDGSKVAFDAQGKIFVATLQGSYIKSCKEVSITK